MSFWESFNKKKFGKYIFLALIIFLLDYSFLLVPIKNIFNRPFQPLREAIYRLNDKNWQNFFSSGKVNSLKRENQELKEKIADQTSEIAQLKYLADENQRLKNLLDFYPENYRFLPAKIIGRSGSDLVINQGESSGVVSGQLVVSGRYLVGQVVEVYDHEAKLAKLGSSSLELPVLIFADRPDCLKDLSSCQKGKGIMVGETIKEILREEEVLIGDLVMLLNDPNGILVGKIGQIWESQDKLFKQAQIEKLIDPDRVIEVFLIVKNN